MAKTMGDVGALRARLLRALILVGVTAVAATSPLAAAGSSDPTAFVPARLLAAAQASPDATFDVIVQGRDTTSGKVASAVRGEVDADPGEGNGLGRRFLSISGVSAQLTGKQLVHLAARKDVLAITRDSALRPTDAAPASAAAPTVSGAAQVGATLTAAPGDWTGGSPLAYGYQWQRCGSAQRAAAVLADRPAGYWRLGESAGPTAADSSGNGHAGTYAGGVANGVPGATPDGAAGFDGLTGSVAVPGVDATSFASGFTLEAWVKTDAPQVNRGIAGKWTYFNGGGILLWIDETGNYSLVVTNSFSNYLFTSVAPVPGQWEHLVGTWDGATLRLYRNGVQIGSKPFAGSPASPSGDFTIGDYDGLGHHLSGAVDDVSFYGHALSPTQVASHYLGCTPIEGATGAAYTAGPADLGSTLRVAVSATDAAGASGSAASAPTDPVAAAPAPAPPANAAAPTIGGSAMDGKTLTAAPGDWTGAGPISYSFQWQRCDASACTDVAGATGASYTAGSSDVGATLRVLVTASGAGGSTAAASSPSGAVAAAPPAAGAGPAISGSPARGIAVAAGAGSWTGTEPLAYAYQWQRCAAPDACADIAGATAAAYTPGAADVGASLRVALTVTGPGGSSTATSAASASVAAFSNPQLWPQAADVAPLWPKAITATGAQPPAIAIVDSGIDASLPDFGGRVAAQVTTTSLVPNSPGDGRGHGTFVASVAAGEAPGHAGAAPDARLVSVDVLDDSGRATTSDVIAAADWIYQNKDAYGIRVANFSLQGTTATSIRYDPLDKAVEKLWLSGVVVVTAAGNTAVGGAESGVPYAPGNDPFVLTVGANDTHATADPADDFAAPWSSYGHTADGFAKPELGAPGREVIGAVPPSSTLVTERPDRVVAPGYMQLSGTSFSAPIVSGAAAELLAAHPGWTPDQVKGALMLSARPTHATGLSSGVGAVDARAAAAVANPPNPNAGLDQYLVADPNGGPVPVFDAEFWGTQTQANPAWGTEFWGTEFWGTAAWGTEFWGTAYWSSSAYAAGSAALAAGATEYWGTGSGASGVDADSAP
jgi:serine protease AprX